MIILNFIKRHWLAFVVVFLCVATSLYKTPDVAEVEAKVVKNEKRADSLHKENVIVDEKIKIIKEKEYVEIKTVDTMSISSLQSYFTDRYGE